MPNRPIIKASERVAFPPTSPRPQMKEPKTTRTDSNHAANGNGRSDALDGFDARKQHIAERGFEDQNELASQAGVSRSTVLKWLKGDDVARSRRKIERALAEGPQRQPAEPASGSGADPLLATLRIIEGMQHEQAVLLGQVNDLRSALAEIEARLPGDQRSEQTPQRSGDGSDPRSHQ